MNHDSALKKLEKYGQQHVLRYYDELTQAEKEELLKQIGETDFEMIKRSGKAGERGRIRPIRALTLSEIDSRREKYRETGIEAIKAGKVGAVLLAGGMGTRLGSEAPKGMYNIGVTRELYIFECLINNLMEVKKQAGTFIPLFVMTSGKNHAATVAFFEEKGYFGYDPEYVNFFTQDMAPATDYEGRVYMEEKGRISTSPNGNGGWFLSMKKSGMLDILHRRGIEWLNVFAVDNVLQRIADPVFVGAVLAEGCASGSKVIRKVSPEEKVGVMCLEDGRPSIVEYMELTEEMRYQKDEQGEYAYNFGVILNYLFNVAGLEELSERSLPLHVVEKKIPYINEKGEKVRPDKPNGYKYEQFILDMIRMMDSCLPFEVVRAKEFAPIKNKTGADSVESARKLLMENGVRL